MGDGLRLVAALRQAGGDLPHGSGGLFGDGVGGDAGFEALGFGKQPLELFQVFRQADVFQRDGVDFAGGAGKVGVDLDDAGIGDDQQRRAVQRQGVGHQLLERQT